MRGALVETVRALPRLGWVSGPSPVRRLERAQLALGLDWLGAKRDDLLEGLCGGTKVRKLDTLLATAPYRDAASWSCLGAIGSGNLATVVSAATALSRHVDAHLVWEPISRGVLENLAVTASGPSALRFHESYLSLVVSQRRLVLGRSSADRAVIARGATQPAGLIGVVLGALELGQQIVEGELPQPDHVVVPYGTGGVAAGLAVALALSGLDTKVTAVSVVPRLASTRWMFRRVVSRLVGHLRRGGLHVAGDPSARVDLVRGFVGPGYGWSTPASVEACDRFADLPLEEVYSGKAMAALLELASGWRGQRVLFWVTPHRRDLPSNRSWRGRLPVGLRARLDGARRPGPTRRRLLIGGAALAGLSGVRLGGYRSIPGVEGRVLAPWEASVVAAVVPVLIPDEPGGPLPLGPTPEEVAANVDRYLQGMAPHSLMEIHGLFALIEHGTGLGCGALRFTRSSAAVQERTLLWLATLNTLSRQAYRGIRDLCLLGWYQDPRTWGPLGYEGPLVEGTGRSDEYGRLVAPAGLPSGLWR